MALGAGIIGSIGEAHGATVLNVAGTARGRKRLTLIVGRSLVTGQACAIRDGCAKTGGAEVAQTAAIAKNRMRFGDRTRAVDVLMAEHIGAKYPAQSQ